MSFADSIARCSLFTHFAFSKSNRAPLFVDDQHRKKTPYPLSFEFPFPLPYSTPIGQYNLTKPQEESLSPGSLCSSSHAKGKTGKPFLSPSLLLNFPFPEGLRIKGRCINFGAFHSKASYNN